MICILSPDGSLRAVTADEQACLQMLISNHGWGSRTILGDVRQALEVPSTAPLPPRDLESLIEALRFLSAFMLVVRGNAWVKYLLALRDCKRLDGLMK